MNKFFIALYKFFKPLTAPQKFLFGLLSAGIILAIGLLFFWATRPDYALLFGSLSPKAAQTIVEELQSNDVSYRLADGGTAIYVPREQVYDLRLKHAESGSAGTDYKGYELFDSNALGMTDFMQRVNLKRALEGELAKTISNVRNVEFARVHLVLPERSPFLATEVTASASVVVTMQPGKRLNTDQISGIASLVSGSVESLDIADVVILDQSGNKISENMSQGSELALSTTQMKVRQGAEAYLTEKGQSMLDRILGPGNSILRLSTEHDFEKIKRESQLIDPESQTVISEEIHTNSASNLQNELLPPDPTLPPALRQPEKPRSTEQEQSQIRIRNYEVNTTQESYEKPVGQITKITASITINEKKQVFKDINGADSLVYTPYTQAELNNIGNLLRSALGLDELRGDILTLTQFRFEGEPQFDFVAQQQELQEQMWRNELIRWLAIIAALTFAFYVLYRILRQNYPEAIPPLFFDGKAELEDKKKDQKAIGKGVSDVEMTDRNKSDIDVETDVYRKRLSPEAQRRLEMKSKMFEEIKNFAEFKPDEAANMMRSMLINRKEE